eukprot:1159127-Pelagomonas_calceolata.AAC.5
MHSHMDHLASGPLHLPSSSPCHFEVHARILSANRLLVHRTTQMYMTLGKIILWTLKFIFGLGLLPSILFQKLVTLHLDWAVEVVMYRLTDQATGDASKEGQLTRMMLW